jgi:hypothetical protein
MSDFQTLPRSYKVSAAKSPFAPKLSSAYRSQSVGELSVDHREKGRVQVPVSANPILDE